MLECRTNTNYSKQLPISFRNILQIFSSKLTHWFWRVLSFLLETFNMSMLANDKLTISCVQVVIIFHYLYCSGSGLIIKNFWKNL